MGPAALFRPRGGVTLFGGCKKSFAAACRPGDPEGTRKLRSPARVSGASSCRPRFAGQAADGESGSRSVVEGLDLAPRAAVGRRRSAGHATVVANGALGTLGPRALARARPVGRIAEAI